MPILDPILQLKLLSLPKCETKVDPKLFYLKYLQIASEQINQNMATVLASIQFKKDLDKIKTILVKYFKDLFTEKNEETSNIYYTILYQMNMLTYSNYDLKGKYFQYSFLNSSFKLFQLDIGNSNFRSWFLSDSPIAILCIYLNSIKDEDLNLLIFEIDLMLAAGFTLVLCISDFTELHLSGFRPLMEILCEHSFAEIHITFNSNKYNENFNKFLKSLIAYYEKINSYFYLYTRYFEIDKNDPKIEIPLIFDSNYNENKPIIIKLKENFNDQIKELIQKLKKLETYSHIKISYFSDPIESSLINQRLSETNPFKICTNGFDQDKIKIFLTDVPLYDKEEGKECSYSCEFANENFRSVCYISSEDFLFLGKTRVKVYFDNTNHKKNSEFFDLKNDQKIEKYVNFDDIHFINPELYVIDQMSLIETESETIKSKCKKIIHMLKNKYVPNDLRKIKIKKNYQLNLRKSDDNEKFDEIFRSALYMYKTHHDQINKEKFQYHLSQIYCTYEIIYSCFNKNDKISGSVYQVPTGEGKSAIIFLISAVLATLKKCVHIVTSNIVLANRDYNESYDYFKNCGLTSTALLHYNEMPKFDRYRFDPSLRKDHYPAEFFGSNLFNNSMSMNFDACKNPKRTNIVFSTITNFECFYLYMTEKCNGKVDDYYKNTVLLIDEADTILIDEITNGTIISRPMQSNSEDVLSFVYDEYCKNNEIENDYLYQSIRNKFPECVDLDRNDIDEMLKELDLVKNNDDFVQGKKYLIVESIEKDESDKPYKEIVPFDFDNKGIMEKNKEYSGFIEQFISIKEKKDRPDENIKFKDISLNYLYISHPIYVNLYENVFGLTGTIGDSYDKNIFLNHYRLESKFMPKKYPNRCYHFPISLCENVDARNKCIVEEVIGFNKKGFPVLVILFSPDEIKTIEKLIRNHKDFNKKQKINIYEGKEINTKPNKESGKEGAISLGTNICGRGTHIDVGQKHLHVILSFYSSNKRALQQAFGRTARKNNFGSVHIISIKEDFNVNKLQMKNDEIDFNLQKMEVLKTMQKEFIEEFRAKRSWIFDLNLDYIKKFTVSERQNLRNTKINVNRYTACYYKYPICMDFITYIDIQTQKIFSLINCPNCKFTWQLFQQYVREMILQSWSLLINKLEKSFISELSDINDIKMQIMNRKNILKEYLKSYLPDETEYQVDIFNTFNNIFNIVNQRYESLIKSTFNTICSWNNSEIIGYTKKVAELSRISIEFRPFSLIHKESSKIKELFNKDPDIAYIHDPELKYKRRNSDKSIDFSITNVLDEIFEKICNIFNEFLEGKINFNFFLRRTLAGCEFGLCYDLDIEIDDPEIIELQNCLFDKNILFVFCIYINSPIPFLAGVLMFMILYMISIIKNLITFAKSVIKNLSTTGLKLITALANYAKSQTTDKVKETAFEKIADFLKDKIMETIEKFKKDKDKYYFLIKMLTDILVDKIKENTSENFDEEFVKNISQEFGKKFKKIGKIKNIINNKSKIIFKIGFLSVLWLASHMLNFQFYFLFQKKLNYSSTIAKDSQYFKSNHDADKIDFYIKKNEKKVNVPNKISLDFTSDLKLVIDGIIDQANETH